MKSGQSNIHLYLIQTHILQFLYFWGLLYQWWKPLFYWEEDKKQTAPSCFPAVWMTQGLAAELPALFHHSPTPLHKRGERFEKKPWYLYFTLLAKEKHKHVLFTCHCQMIQWFCSPVEMSQFEMLSLMQLLAAISTFVRGIAHVRCRTTSLWCQGGRNHFPSMLLDSTIKQVMLFTELSFIYHFTQQGRPINTVSVLFLSLYSSFLFLLEVRKQITNWLVWILSTQRCNTV